MASYKGPTVFVHPDGSGTQGVHYPVGEDGHADLSRPLFWDNGKGQYRDKEDGDPSHFEAYHVDHTDIIPEGGGDSVTVTDEEMAAVQKVLDEIRGGQ